MPVACQTRRRTLTWRQRWSRKPQLSPHLSILWFLRLYRLPRWQTSFNVRKQTSAVWLTSAIPELERLRQEDCLEFKDSWALVGDIASKEKKFENQEVFRLKEGMKYS